MCHSVLPFCDLYHIGSGWVFVVSGSVMGVSVCAEDKGEVRNAVIRSITRGGIAWKCPSALGVVCRRVSC